jgi:hypothetical protein
MGSIFGISIFDRNFDGEKKPPNEIDNTDATANIVAGVLAAKCFGKFNHLDKSKLIVKNNAKIKIFCGAKK